MGRGVLRLEAVAEPGYGGDELVEGLRAVAVVGIAHSLECALDGNGGHVEGAAKGGGMAGIHELHAARAVLGAAGVEVDLQVADGLEGGTELEVLVVLAGRRCGHAVVAEQPVALEGLADIGVARESEGEVEARREEVARALSEHIAHVRHESRQRQRPLVGIGEVDRPHHHQEARGLLGGVVPPLVVERLLRRDAELEGQRLGCRCGFGSLQ